MDVNETVKLYFSKKLLIGVLIAVEIRDILDIGLLFSPVISITFLLSVG